MKRVSNLLVLGTTLAMLGAALTPSAFARAASAPIGSGQATSAGASHHVYTATVDPAQLGLIRASGVDREDLHGLGGSGKGTRVEVVLGTRQADELRAKGIKLVEKVASSTSSAQRRSGTGAAAAPTGVFRKYSGTGGLAAELRSVAASHPALTKLVVIGKTVQGQDILAVKVTKDAKRTQDGKRPAVLYISAQHAREWITPEMTRRLLHYYLDQYPTNRGIKKIIDTEELWFVPVANPDGYDYTFDTDRLWRKNLHDNNGDGVIGPGDGVDPNRNYPTKWGYDNEGSSDVPFSETYRGASPGSEPETQAIDRLMRKIGFAFMMNYHSAAELLLYGTGWQVATPSPDDVIYEAMAGDDANSAIPGYDPDISAELYTTNGEIDEHAENTYDTLSFTAEMSTCQTASDTDPNDEFLADDCESVFNFPDSEALIQAEFVKNIPFALAVATSAPNPDHPTSVVGRSTADFVPDTFTASYGDPQPVAVTARRSLKNKTAYWSINGGRVHSAALKAWKGGERYGSDKNFYYGEYRAVVRGAKPGAKVKVWFGAHKAKSSAPFTYTLVQDRSPDVLVVSDEDYGGVNPTYPPSVTGPKYAQKYVDALKAAGLKASVWDTTAQGVPHPLGVLSHAKAVIWYFGDNRLTQDPEDELTQYGAGNYPDLSVAERAQYLTIALRDYLNEGGKLVVTGETAGYTGLLGQSLGGIYYGLDGAPDQECAVTSDPFGDCLLLADDFFQYYLGAFTRSPVSGPAGFRGFAAPLQGVDVSFGGPAVADNPLDEAGTFTPTSAILPVAQFPQFSSWGSGTYTFGGAGSDPYSPVEGDWYVGETHVDDAYARLSRTFDLGGVTASQAPTLSFQLSYDTEPGYDNVIVEAHHVGQDDWTTLPDLGGLTTSDVPAECEVGFLLEEHPFLEHYLTLGATECTPTGTTGSFNAMTANSGGWQPVSFDLSAFAGGEVEIAVSYVSDSASGGVGAFVDDTSLVVDGVATEAEGFEAGLGAWSVPGAPEGSPGNAIDFTRSSNLLAASITTPDTVLFGFGLEQIGTSAALKKVSDAVSSLVQR